MSALADRATLAAYRAGWGLVRKLPERAAYTLFDTIAEVTHRRGGSSVQRLRSNYARVRPELSEAELEDLVGAGLRSYMRYWCDAFRLPDRSAQWLRDHVELVGIEPVRERVERGEAVVVFLGHLGNWDTLGAWATSELAPVTTVAERLKPEELFEEFLDFRRSLGMTILPLTGGGMGPFPSLLRAARAGALIPLLADRDLTAHGVPVELCGSPARMAPGPAALALASGAPLYVLGATYRERPDGGHNVWAQFLGPVQVPDGTREEQIAAMTQECADLLGRTIGQDTQDWHMMQRVFTDEPARVR